MSAIFNCRTNVHAWLLRRRQMVSILYKPQDKQDMSHDSHKQGHKLYGSFRVYV